MRHEQRLPLPPAVLSHQLLPSTALLPCPAFVVKELDTGEQLQGEIKTISLLVHGQMSKCITRRACSPPVTLSEMWLVPKTVMY